MKRIALLVGNTTGLPGVTVDLNNYIAFLKSDFGGAWYESEIIVMSSPSRHDLITKIRELKMFSYDFAFVIFSGHGAYQKGTMLEINNEEECIYESELKNIATRQISVFDCCRNIIRQSITDSRSIEAKLSGGTISNIRARYDARIMSAEVQQASLYACSIGESALDTENGGLYSKNLLAASRRFNSDFLTINNAHDSARIQTTREAIDLHAGHIQNPTSEFIRCLSSHQLIIGVNPNISQTYFR